MQFLHRRDCLALYILFVVRTTSFIRWRVYEKGLHLSATPPVLLFPSGWAAGNICVPALRSCLRWASICSRRRVCEGVMLLSTLAEVVGVTISMYFWFSVCKSDLKSLWTSSMILWSADVLLPGFAEYKVRRRALRVADNGSTTVINQRLVPGMDRKADTELGWYVACCALPKRRKRVSNEDCGS